MKLALFKLASELDLLGLKVVVLDLHVLTKLELLLFSSQRLLEDAALLYSLYQLFVHLLQIFS